MKKFFIMALLLTTTFVSWAQRSNNLSLEVEEGEYWYGLAVNNGHMMPFKEGYEIDLHYNAARNQASPIILSSNGRYIWSEDPFKFEMTDDQIIISNNDSEIIVEKGGENLRDAYNAAQKRFFPAKGTTPNKLLFEKPQYNTWIELIYDQNQEDILKYAHAIIDNGFPAGVLMIDDNWFPTYGDYTFRKDRFPDAKAMVDELHDLGFKVMMWVSPFITADTEVGRMVTKNKWVLMDNMGDKTMTVDKAYRPAIVQWWNGYGLLLDLSNPGSAAWMKEQLDTIMERYGVDGFKLDGGDPKYYKGDNIISYGNVDGNTQTMLWGKLGLNYSFCEYKSMWKMGGEPIAERLRDKFHTWESLQEIVPHITTAGLLGYAFTCPDMIGGGCHVSFMNVDSSDLNMKLVVRSAQSHALMPMMQFSVAPWRILDAEHLAAVAKTIDIREQFLDEILALVDNSAKTGEPIVANMEYYFPHQGFAECKDQYMLGDEIMVAPVVTESDTREVLIPKGKWVDCRGKKIKGGKSVEYTAALDELLWFRRVK